MSAVTESRADTDPQVAEMVAAVSEVRCTSYVQTLQDFGTRYRTTQGNTDAGIWLYEFFENLGLEVEFHEFVHGSGTEVNIIARIPGRVTPEEIVAISGHFDTTSQAPLTNAPGADDDASGIAGVLEAALILRDYSFDRTIEFYCYNSEEQGRLGSRSLAADYIAEGRNIVGVINADMIAYWPTGWDRDLDVAYEPVSEALADHVIDACNRYVGIPIAKHLSGVCRDDHVSFTDLGIPAVTNMDCWEAHNGGQNGESTPHYHKTTDTIDSLDLPRMTQCIQVEIASLAELAGSPEVVGVETDLPMLPVDSMTIWNRPNPFHSSTEIRFVQDAALTDSALRIYDTSGRLVRSFPLSHTNEHEGSVQWDGLDANGAPLAGGVYFYRLESADGSTVSGTERATLLR